MHNRSLLSRLLEGCVLIFIAALLLHWTVNLLAAVWAPLLGIGIVISAAYLAILLRRFHRERW